MILSSPVSARVREAVLIQVTDPAIGIMKTLDGIRLRDGLIDPRIYLIDFTPGKAQFFESALGPDDLEATTPVKYPLCTLAVSRATNKNIEKNRTFSGVVYLDLIFHLSWSQNKAPEKAEIYPDAFEEACFFCFNDPHNQGWATPLVYNGDLDFVRSPVMAGKGENFRQSMKAALTFEVSE